MSRENVELLRGVIEDFRAGSSAAVGFWREWLAAWETFPFEYELVDARERVVAVSDDDTTKRQCASPALALT